MLIIGLTWLYAFAPILGWRLAFGHLNLLLGALLFLCLLSTLTAVLSANLTGTFLAVQAVALSHSYLTNGHQTKLYSLVFGLPILIALAYPFQDWPSWQKLVCKATRPGNRCWPVPRPGLITFNRSCV